MIDKKRGSIQARIQSIHHYGRLPRIKLGLFLDIKSVFSGGAASILSEGSPMRVDALLECRRRPGLLRSDPKFFEVHPPCRHRTSYVGALGLEIMLRSTPNFLVS